VLGQSGQPRPHPFGKSINVDEILQLPHRVSSSVRVGRSGSPRALARRCGIGS
jgi:hypothetical protein